MSEPATVIVTVGVPVKVGAVCSGKMDLGTAFVSKLERETGKSQGEIIELD